MQKQILNLKNNKMVCFRPRWIQKTHENIKVLKNFEYMRLKNLKIAKNITWAEAHFQKPSLKSFESRFILSTENWIALTNPKRSNIPKSSERKFHPMIILLVENAYELRIDKKFSNWTRSYGNFGKWPKYKAICSWFLTQISNYF